MWSFAFPKYFYFWRRIELVFRNFDWVVEKRSTFFFATDFVLTDLLGREHLGKGMQVLLPRGAQPTNTCPEELWGRSTKFEKGPTSRHFSSFHHDRPTRRSYGSHPAATRQPPGSQMAATQQGFYLACS